MLYIIGLGLNEEGFSFEAYNAVKNSRRVYLESYTVEFPFSKEELEVKLEKKIKELKREDVESDRFEKEAKGRKLVLGKMLVCSLLGTKRSKIYYKKFMEFKKEKKNLKIQAPFCFVIPSESLNMVEKKVLERF